MRIPQENQCLLVFLYLAPSPCTQEQAARLRLQPVRIPVPPRLPASMRPHVDDVEVQINRQNRVRQQLSHSRAVVRVAEGVPAECVKNAFGVNDFKRSHSISL